jgi:hypothetical protein
MTPLLLLLLQVKLVLERGTGSLPPWYFQGREGIATWEVRAPESTPHFSAQRLYVIEWTALQQQQRQGDGIIMYVVAR